MNQQVNRKSLNRLSSFQILSLTVLLIPLWWLLGVKFVIFHLAAAAAFLVYLKNGAQEKSGPASFWKTSPELVLLLGFILLYAVSIAVHFGDIPLPRKIASLNNWSFWVIGFFVVFVVSKGLRKKDLLAFLRCFPIFGALSGLFVMLAFLFGLITGRTLQLPSLLMMALPESWLEIISRKALLLQSSLLLNIVGHDKIFQRQIPRSPGFNIYTTALGLTMIVVLLLSILYFSLKGNKKGMFPVLFLEGAALILSFSRMTLLAFGAASAFVLLVAFVPKALQWKLVAVGLLAVLVFFIVVPPSSVWDAVSEFRRGSTVWRGRLYKMTIDESLKQPFLGHGFKPRTDEFPIPVASHSTWLGVLYRTGFAGLAVFLLFWILVLRTWWRGRHGHSPGFPMKTAWVVSGIGLISGLLWMLTDDLDAPPITAFVFFLLVGLSMAVARWGAEKA